MDSIDLYYDHYKDTFEQLKGYLKKRDNYTIILFIMVIVLSFQLQNPVKSSELANELIKHKIDNRISIDYKYVNTVLTFVFLWLTIQYYQINFTIEKIYNYIHEMENLLSKNGAYNISREGANYLKNYPWLSSLVHVIYTILFPLLIVTIAIFKIYYEYVDEYNLLFIDSIALCLAALSSLLYLSNRYLKEEVFKNSLYPNLKWHQRLFKYLHLDKYISDS